MKSLLERWKCKADIVDDGKELINRVCLKKYDLIFMDINMPKMNGYQTTQWLKENNNVHFNASTPIIALTASAFTKERNKILKLGADDFISKPFDPNDISKKMCEYFESDSKIDNNNSVVDLSHLKKLSNNNDSFVDEMIQIFIDGTPDQLNNLTILLKKQNWQGLKIAVHTLKSSLYLIGLQQSYEDLHLIETNIGNNNIDPDQFTSLIQRTITFAKRAVVELKK